MNIKAEVELANRRIRAYIRETFLRHSPPLSEQLNAAVYLKLENMQFTGSFKVRGAINKLLTLSAPMREQGIVTASSGNHGAAVAYALHQLKTKGIIFLPVHASKAKIANIKRYTDQIEFFGEDTLEAETKALAYAREHDMAYISPYNDPYVVAGQGTIAIELLKQLEKVEVVFVPLGGGGLISGIAGYLKSVNPAIQIVGCSPVNSPVMIESIGAGEIIEMTSTPTLSDGTAGGLEPNAMTFILCQKFVDEYVMLTEDEIKSAMIQFIEEERLLVEGSAALSLAACKKVSKKYAGKTIALIVSGGNLSLDTLRSVVCLK